jgi:hypothetical protein
MTDLPALPGVVHRTRPLPPGGLDAAIRVGRRRRNRFVGATGGAVLAAAVGLALLVQSPSLSDESLQYASPRPAPPVSESAEPSPAATPSGPIPEPQPTPTQGGQVPALPPVPPRMGPTPSPSPSAVDRVRAREDYVEQPQEVAAPATCWEPPDGSAGPVVYGGVTACGNGTAAETSARRGGSVSATTDLCKAYGSDPAVLGWDTGREHEVVVTTSSGTEVYRFSAAYAFPQGAHERTLEPGRCLNWTGVWDTRYTDGRLVPAGSYRMTLYVGSDTVDGDRRPPGSNGSLAFTVTVEE